MTAAQDLLLEETAKKAVVVQALGEWILRQTQLVKTDGSLLAAVVQHDRLQSTLVSMLAAIGLKAHEAPAVDLHTYVASRDAKRSRDKAAPKPAKVAALPRAQISPPTPAASLAEQMPRLVERRPRRESVARVETEAERVDREARENRSLARAYANEARNRRRGD